MSDLSTGDILAMTRNNGEGFLEGNGIIILILFLLFFNGGYGGFGGAGQAALTRAEMQDGFNNQNLVNTMSNLQESINNGFNCNTLAMTNGFNGLQTSINNLGFQMQQCCCDLKSTMASQVEQNLRDKLADKDRELNTAIFTASQLTQTRRLEDFILANKATTTATS